MESGSKKFTMTHKCRRNINPRHRYVTRTVSARNQTEGMEGFFELLPAEVRDTILEYIPVVDLSVLSMVSKSINAHVVGYVSTQAWATRVIVLTLRHSGLLTLEEHILSHYRSLGVLFKRCTLLLPTKERLKFIFSKFRQLPNFTLDVRAATPGCLGFSSYGVFVQTLIAGWAEPECHRVFSFLCDFTNLPYKIETVARGKPGDFHDLELQIRLFCRSVLLDPWQNRRETLFWLTRILKPWPTTVQARLLFILYGPLRSDDTISWSEMRDSVVRHGGLWELAKALILLYTDLAGKDWPANTLLAIIDEITVTPEAWHMENVARMLVLSGNNTCYCVLSGKALDRRFFEIARLMVFIIMVCERDGRCMTWPVKMMGQICQVFRTSEDKWSFINSVESMFSEVAMEMYEVIMAGNRNEGIETFQTLCVLLSAAAHFHTKMVFSFYETY
ncbi:hypothetical protein AAFF_G00008610 [Aldrovandia affinis]|uniref:F-box domain-containing protein n=1 Tax=Aldrovandia affinis TaxID=143900 RepID=A0AAD7T6N2_9TELE|nr:hypothetical protein AAFF_G00008610 [Aldrovandia affinis]